MVVNLIIAGLLTALGVRLPSRPLQLGYVAVVLVVEPRWDTYYLVALVWSVVLVLRAERLRGGVLTALGCWLAVLGLVKFTWLLLATFAWLLLIAGCWRGRRFEAILGYPLAVAAIWLALGQAPRHFVPYLSASWQIATGYGEAMAANVNVSLLPVYLGLGVLLLLAILSVRWLRTTGRQVRPIAGFVLIGVCVLLSWKHGFTRQDSHVILFFNFLALVPFAGAALAWTGTSPKAVELGLLAVIVGGALAGRGSVPSENWFLRLAVGTRDLVTPQAMRQRCQQGYDAIAADCALPRLNALIGTETVDQLSCDQGVVLLNRWNYRPRPVFQSYSAYTPRLLADNAAFFRSDRAPRFLLWKLQPLDQRVPTSEDGPALLEILRRYHPVAEEGDFLLLERRATTTATGARAIVWEGDVGFGEEVRIEGLPGEAHIVTIRIVDTTRGKWTKLFFRPPELFLRVRTADEKAFRYRLIPALASAGFLLDPLLRDETDVQRWYRGASVRRVVSFAVHGSPAAQACYGESMHVVVE